MWPSGRLWESISKLWRTQSRPEVSDQLHASHLGAVWCPSCFTCGWIRWPWWKWAPVRLQDGQVTLGRCGLCSFTVRCCSTDLSTVHKAWWFQGWNKVGFSTGLCAVLMSIHCSWFCLFCLKEFKFHHWSILYIFMLFLLLQIFT